MIAFIDGHRHRRTEGLVVGGRADLCATADQLQVHVPRWAQTGPDPEEGAVSTAWISPTATSNGVLNRTTVYAIATGLLGGLYAAFGVVAQLLLGTVAASPLIDSKPAVAITTFLFLSAFRPVRDRVQKVGYSNLGFADALRRQVEQGNLRYIGIRHEGAAAFAASA